VQCFIRTVPACPGETSLLSGGWPAEVASSLNYSLILPDSGWGNNLKDLDFPVQSSEQAKAGSSLVLLLSL